MLVSILIAALLACLVSYVAGCRVGSRDWHERWQVVTKLLSERDALLAHSPEEQLRRLPPLTSEERASLEIYRAEQGLAPLDNLVGMDKDHAWQVAMAREKASLARPERPQVRHVNLVDRKGKVASVEVV